MQSLNQKSQWQTYKQLELIPDSVPNPDAKVATFKFGLVKFGLGRAWRSLLSLLIDELVDQEQQVEYIERCWALNEFGEKDNPTSSLQRLWVLMN